MAEILFEPYAIASRPFKDLEETVHLHITFPRTIDHFSGLVSLAEAMQSIDGLMRSRITPRGQELRNELLAERPRVVKFRVSSDPVAELSAKWPWVAILFAVLGAGEHVIRHYDKYKTNVPAIKADLSAFVDGVKGLTAVKKAQVIAGATAVVDDMLALPEDQLRRLADRIGKMRASLVGSNNEPPSIDFKD
jgi:hypothetical protein